MKDLLDQLKSYGVPGQQQTSSKPPSVRDVSPRVNPPPVPAVAKTGRNRSVSIESVARSPTAGLLGGNSDVEVEESPRAGGPSRGNVAAAAAGPSFADDVDPDDPLDASLSSKEPGELFMLCVETNFHG
jgi:hypothetical protein